MTTTLLRVYPIPPVLPDNPYLDRLYSHIALLPAVCLNRTRPLRRAILSALRAAPAAHVVVHLHFFDEICQRPSRIQTHLRSAAFLALLSLLRARGARLVWTAHNLLPHEAYHPHLARQLNRAVLARSDAVIVFSPAVAHELTANLGQPQRLAIIPHGHFVGCHGPRPARDEARALLGLPLDAFVYVLLGTLRPYKGFEDAIDAFATLAPDGERPPLLVIAGQPKSAAYGAQIAVAAVRSAGVVLRMARVPEEHIAAYWAAADVAVFPYRRLTNSGALIDAMSYAVPVIAPDTPAVRDLVQEDENGFLFPLGDIAALRAAMERARRHTNLAALGRAALERMRQDDWRDIAAATLEVYRAVVADRSTMVVAPPRDRAPTAPQGERHG
jgi:glycosyltransferase involved in cell wall biosynthesis